MTFSRVLEKLRSSTTKPYFTRGMITGATRAIRLDVKKRQIRSSWPKRRKIFFTLSATSLKKQLVAYARSLGFESVGVTRADALVKEETYLKRWISEGRAGEM